MTATAFAALLTLAAGPPMAGELVLRLEVRGVVKGAGPAEPKAPWDYKRLDERIKELDGKPVLALTGKRVTIQLLENAPGLGGRKEPFTGDDFARALLTGKVLPQAKMRWHLQSSEECLVRTPGGDFRLGIYYSPIGYVVLPNGECYWMLFDEKAAR